MYPRFIDLVDPGALTEEGEQDTVWLGAGFRDGHADCSVVRIARSERLRGLGGQGLHGCGLQSHRVIGNRGTRFGHRDLDGGGLISNGMIGGGSGTTGRGGGTPAAVDLAGRLGHARRHFGFQGSGGRGEVLVGDHLEVSR